MRLVQVSQGKLIFVIYALMVVFGWWVSNDLLESSPNLRLFTDFMASIVPQIDRVTTLGGATAGNANRVLYSVLWVVGIVLGTIYAGLVFKKLARGESLDWEGGANVWLESFSVFRRRGLPSLVGGALYEFAPSRTAIGQIQLGQ